MSWFNECTLSYEEVEEIRLYLMILQIWKERELLSKQKLQGLIDKLGAWIDA